MKKNVVIDQPETPVMNQKVTIVGPHFDRVGGVREVHKLLDLEGQGLGTYFSVHEGAKFETSVLKKTWRLLKKYWQFYRRIQTTDLVLLNSSLLPKSFLRDAVFAIITRWRRKKLVVFWHGWLDEYEEKISRSYWLKKLHALSFARADGLIVLGSIFKKKLENLGPLSKVPILQYLNVVDNQYLDDFAPGQRNLDKKKFTILFLARLYRHKGLYIAIDTFRAICRAFPDRQLELVIAGSGREFENAQAYVEQNSIKNVVFPGYVSGEEKHQTLKNADLFLFPTYFPEGLPLSVLEAMLYGLPVITRPVGGLTDVIENGVHGYLIESLDIPDYVEPIKKLLLDEDHYRAICENNYAFALENVVKEKARLILCDFVNTI